VWLHGLWAVPVLALLAWLMLRSRRAALAKLGPLAAERVSARAMGVHRARAALHVMAAGLVLLALAGPRWGWRWQELKREGLDIVVVLDTSLSMGAEDVDPSRMERARRELLDLADMLAGDRVGMVIFAGGAYPRMPLTVDYGALRFVAKDSTTQTLLARGSDMGAAIDTAVELLDMEHDADKAILLISDGEDHVGDAVAAAERAAEAGAHVYVLGVGTTDGAPVPDPQGGFKKDGRGDLVLTRLGEDLLQDVAKAGRGAYVRSVAGRGDLQALYQDEIRGRLQGAELGVRRERIWNEHFQWPLAGAVLLLLIGALLRPGRLRLPGAAAGLVLAAALAGGAPAHAQDRVAELAARQAADPDDLVLAEQLGQALYEAGDFNGAHEVLTGVAERSLDGTQRNRARTNAGLAAYRSGQLTRAVEDWQRVLQDDPEHPAAKANAQAVQQEILRRLGQEPPPQDGQQDGEPQDGEQDGEPQDGQQQDGQQQDGQQQDGQQQDGQQQDGQQQDGQQQEADSQQGQQDGQQQPPETDGTRPEDAQREEPEQGDPGSRGEIEEKDGQDGQSSQDALPVGAQQADTGAPDGEQVPALGRAGEISPEEAQRLLDGVEEGTPRVPRTRHREGDKDW
jgi:Ca-activated chloride channel family protein